MNLERYGITALLDGTIPVRVTFAWGDGHYVVESQDRSPIYHYAGFHSAETTVSRDRLTNLRKGDVCEKSKSCCALQPSTEVNKPKAKSHTPAQPRKPIQ